MFGREEYEKYFRSVNEMEEEMAQFIDQAILLFKEKDIVAKLEGIRNDEIMHCRISKDLFNYI